MAFVLFSILVMGQILECLYKTNLFVDRFERDEVGLDLYLGDESIALPMSENPIEVLQCDVIQTTSQTFNIITDNCSKISSSYWTAAGALTGSSGTR